MAYYMQTMFRYGELVLELVVLQQHGPTVWDTSRRCGNVQWNFGAVGDGITLDTAAVQKALDCCKKNGGTVVVPGGKTYKIGTIQIYSNTELYLESGAVLKQSDRIEDLRSISIVDKSNNETDIPSYINCEYNGKPAHYFIYATGENIRITGYGAIDGNESIYYGTETRYHIEGAWYPRTPLLYI